jgi:hypothetical protein
MVSKYIITYQQGKDFVLSKSLDFTKYENIF